LRSRCLRQRFGAGGRLGPDPDPKGRVAQSLQRFSEQIVLNQKPKCDDDPT
jgi:hypothetical protein